jgi:glycosyltransferase involved in cell wall biosynthesis
MRRLPLRRLVLARPGNDRIAYHELWPRRHPNPRYEALLPRLERVDAFTIELSPRRIPAALQFRALYRTRRLRHSLVVRALGRRYRWLLVTDPEQIPHFGGEGIVADVDDPRYTPREVALLNTPAVRCIVFTLPEIGRRYEELGLRTPWHVIEQGAAIGATAPEAVRAVADRLRRPGEIVVGYLGSWLRSGGDQMWNVDHLLDLWEGIRKRVPGARLWLLGNPDAAVEARCRRRDDILLLGRVPNDEVLSYVSNFDVALYPRQGEGLTISRMKLADYVGAGVATVAYDAPQTRRLADASVAVLVQTPEEFVDAVSALAADEGQRGRLAAAAREARRGFDWNTLARRYEQEVLDRYL